MTAPPLRDYQAAAIEQGRAAIRAGHKRIVFVSPTGSGKTRLGSEIVRLSELRDRKVLWLASRRELINDAHAAILDEGCDAAILMASHGPGDASKPIQVASVPTLIARKLRPPADLIVIDEAHHGPAARAANLLRDYPDATVIGLTATPERTDGVGLREIFDHMIVVAQIREMVELGFLVPCRVLSPDEDPGKTIAARPVDSYLKHAPGTSAIVSSLSVATAAEHAAQFREMGIEARSVDATNPDERDRQIARFASGALPVICHVNILSEGTNIPRAETIILAGKIGSAGGFIQRIGRGRRPFPGKLRCLVLDLAGNSHQYGHPDEPRRYSLEGAAIRRVEDEPALVPFCRCCGAIVVPGLACTDCGTVASRPRKMPTVRGRVLVDIDKIRAKPPSKSALALAGMMRDCAAKGKKPGAAMFMFRSVFKFFPRKSVRVQAEKVFEESRGK